MSARDMLKWAPLPVRSANGLAMKLAKAPCLRAISLAIMRKYTRRSAMLRASVNMKSVSNWPLASSWSKEYTSQPCSFMASTISSMIGRLSISTLGS